MARAPIPNPDAQPIHKFARFFKAYNFGLSLVIAAIPILVSVWDVVPFYDSTKNYLTLVTSISAYLLVGFIFSQRAAIGRLYFPKRRSARVSYSVDIESSRAFKGCPLILLILSAFCFYIYFPIFNSSIERVAYEYVSPGASGERVCDALSLSPGEQRAVTAEFAAFGKSGSVTVDCASWLYGEGEQKRQVTGSRGIRFPDPEVVQTILSYTPAPSIPYSFWQSLFFLVAFLSAASAFILMGLKEYIQEELGIRDEDLIYDPLGASVVKRFYLDVPGLYGEVAFSSVDPNLLPQVSGPFCTWHDRRPTPKGFDEEGKTLGWMHVSVQNGKRVEEPCLLSTQLSERELDLSLENVAKEVIARQKQYVDARGAARGHPPAAATVLPPRESVAGTCQ